MLLEVELNRLMTDDDKKYPEYVTGGHSDITKIIKQLIICT